jgi:hypothetical protein
LIQEDLLRAISIRQPLVELILTGEKDIEFRSRPTNIRERVYLYASRSLTTVDGYPEAQAQLLPRGLIVGSVEIIDCLCDEEGCGYILASPVRYLKPWRPHGVPQPCFWRPTR